MTISLLVAEDDPDQRHYMVRMFERRGLKVYEAADGQQAIPVFFNHPDITCIVSDFAMGGGDLDGDALYAATHEELERRGGTFIIATNTMNTVELQERLHAQRLQVITKVNHVSKTLDLLGVQQRD